MSFILDALRKSESQRRLEAVPEVMRVPMAVSRDHLPGWAVTVMTLLALALVAAIGVAWRDQHTRAVDSTARIEPSAEGSGATTVGSAEVPAADRPVATAEPAPGPAPQAERAPTPDAAVAPPPSATARAATTPGVSPVIEIAALPSVAALQAAGIAIPQLDLQLLVTSSTRENRLVVINGRRYREGERLSEGPEVLEIVPDGAVLRLDGTNFLLVTD